MAVVDARLDSVESGLDALELARAPRRSWLRRAPEVVLPKFAAIAVFIGIWQLVYWLRLKDPSVLPSPRDVWSSFSDEFRAGHITEAVWTSVHRGAVGYLASIVIGTPLGLLIARVRMVRLAIGSLVASLQSLPSVVWVPVGLVWFPGDFQAMTYFVVIMGAVPSIAGGMVAAVDTTSPLLIRAGRAMGARGFALYRHVIVPAALPGYIAGLKQAWSFAWRSLMAAEIIVSAPDLGLGLGQLIDNGRALFDYPSMFAAIFTILAVGIAIDGLIFGPLDRLVRSRRGLLSEA